MQRLQSTQKCLSKTAKALIRENSVEPYTDLILSEMKSNFLRMGVDNHQSIATAMFCILIRFLICGHRELVKASLFPVCILCYFPWTSPGLLNYDSCCGWQISKSCIYFDHTLYLTSLSKFGFL